MFLLQMTDPGCRSGSPLVKGLRLPRRTRPDSRSCRRQIVLIPVLGSQASSNPNPPRVSSTTTLHLFLLKELDRIAGFEGSDVRRDATVAVCSSRTEMSTTQGLQRPKVRYREATRKRDESALGLAGIEPQPTPHGFPLPHSQLQPRISVPSLPKPT